MEALQQTAAVLGVLLLLLLALWWLRRRGMTTLSLRRNSAARRMESLERLPLTPQHTLHLVRLGGVDLLIASSPAGCALVHTAGPGEGGSLRRAAP